MPSRRQNQQFQPTPFEVILAGPEEMDPYFDADDVSFAADRAGPYDGAKTFIATPLAEILTGPATDEALMGFDPESSKGLRPRILQVREAGRGFAPEFGGEQGANSRFRLFDGENIDDPFLSQLSKAWEVLDIIRQNFREQEKDGLPPRQSDIEELEKWERALEEFYRQYLF